MGTDAAALFGPNQPAWESILDSHLFTGAEPMRRHLTSASIASASIATWFAYFLAITCSLFVFTSSAFASTETVLHNFTGHQGGAYPIFGMVFDNAGNLYGITSTGGSGFSGNAFELSPNGDGGWDYTQIYSFTNCSAACYPQGPLTLDDAGNLYGTAQAGGPANNGTVFKLTPSDGSWSLTVLYSFGQNGSTDGSAPNGVVYFNGGLYGTTSQGGKYAGGTVFSVTPNPDGGWSETVLHSFRENNIDGNNPMAGVTLDAKGNIYGTTSEGGPSQAGTVFELSQNRNGTWYERILHSFNVTDGDMPWYGSLILDQNGNLYGTTGGGGSGNYGTVFELTRSRDVWSENVLHNFAGGEDGATPDAGVVMDSEGRLYGTTVEGGGRGVCEDYPNPTNLYCGTAFLLTPSPSGSWALSFLHRFANGADGGQPTAAVVLDRNDNVYGVASQGGTDGVAFELQHPSR
jgi:uncharacterized repeat protein (TIGR03803 family)